MASAGAFVRHRYRRGAGARADRRCFWRLLQGQLVRDCLHLLHSTIAFKTEFPLEKLAAHVKDVLFKRSVQVGYKDSV
eukprot:2957582-Amphidinium_carterae.1